MEHCELAERICRLAASIEGGLSLYSLDAPVKSPLTSECHQNAKMHELMQKDGLQTSFALIDIFSMNANIRAR